MLRQLILAAADSPRVRRFVGKYGMRLGAAQFVAGETLDQAVVTLRGLNEAGLRTNTTLLGEFVQDAAEAELVVRSYEEVLRRIQAERLQTNVALKLTHLGVELDEELGYANVERLVAEAARHGNFIRIDMEDSSLVDVTLRIYRRLREAGHDNVGTVLQSYLYRSEDDLESLLPLKPNLRIVKGAYKEPESVAYPRKADVDTAYARLVARSIAEGGFTAVATHDEKLIEHALSIDPGPERMELQMLYGVENTTPARSGRERQAGPLCGALRAGLVPLPDAPARRAPGEPLVLPEERPR